jgi:hypothetical protein
LANPVAAPIIGARQFVAGVDQQSQRYLLLWSRAPMRRLFILWSTLRASEIELFCATASFGFDHLSPIAIHADDCSQKVGLEDHVRRS